MREEIETIEAMTAGLFSTNYLAQGRPVRIRREPGLRNTAATWSLDYLAAKHIGHLIPVEHYESGDQNKQWTYVDMDYTKYIEYQRNPSLRKKYFLMDQPLREVFPNAAAEISPPPFLAQSTLIGSFVYTGVDTFSPVHYHRAGAEAVLTQIVGKKRARLYPARQFRLLYPKPWHAALPHTSQIPFQGADEVDLLKQYPKLAEATTYECIVEPGDALFIPQGWFHIMEGFGENVSVTFFFKGRLHHGYRPLVLRDQLCKAYEKTLAVPLARLHRRLTAR